MQPPGSTIWNCFSVNNDLFSTRVINATMEKAFAKKRKDCLYGADSLLFSTCSLGLRVLMLICMTRGEGLVCVLEQFKLV